MKNGQKIKWIAAVLLVCSCAVFSGFGAVSEKVEEESGREKTDFDAVPYFKDDYGSDTQLVDGWLYSYWSRSLCRYNPDTMEEQVLYEALSPQDGCFCVEDGYIYFIEKPAISFLGKVTGTLYRMKCDGSELIKLVAELPLSEENSYGAYYHYDLIVYDDILYLLPGQAGTEQALFFRLNGGGRPQQLEAEETVYGKVAEPYSDACFCYSYASFPSLPYCLKHYGYGFVTDSEENLYYYDADSGVSEQITVLNEADGERFGQCVLTNDSIVYRDADSIWHAVNLGNNPENRTIGKLDCYSFDFWDEKGLYLVEREDDHLKVQRLGWDGEEETLYYWIRNSSLSTSVYGDYVRLIYSDGKYLYYDGMNEGDGVVYRITLEDEENSAEPELFAVYYDSPVKDISIRETISTTYQIDETGDSGKFSMTTVYLTEDTSGAEKINVQLEDIYAAQQEYIEEVKGEVRDLAFSEYKADWRWSSTLAEISYTASVDYLDEKYIGFCVSWYQYWDGAAHGIYGATYYVFDRELGKKLELTDVVDNTPEDACRIIAPYVEAVADWGTEEAGWERSILDDGRFFLTGEGVGIHFDVYEITCYAAGSQDIIVPYEKFRMKNAPDREKNG